MSLLTTMTMLSLLPVVMLPLSILADRLTQREPGGVLEGVLHRRPDRLRQ